MAPESASAVRIALEVQDWPGHQAGQHVDVRLTAEDGYAAQRSYSIASAPHGPYVELLVQALPDGEVSPYLTREVRAGDAVEVRGPVGSYFVWDPDLAGPVQLVAGGAGVVPFLSMVAHHRASASRVPLRLLYAARSQEDLLGDGLLADPGAGVAVTVALSRRWPPGWPGPTGRVDRAVLLRHALPPADEPRCYVCGPTAFVEVVADLLVDLGHDPGNVRTERFGASGGTS